MIKGMKYSPKTGVFHRAREYHKRHNGCTRGCLFNNGYRMLARQGKRYSAHRLAFMLMGVDIPKGYQVDHINGTRDDNRWCNLRLVTPRENGSNRVTHREGRLIGATWHKAKNKWGAQIQVNKVNNHLGYFSTEKEAHDAYMEARNERS